MLYCARMAKDRGRPFSRKHRRYWLPVTGGMLLIGAINVGLGFWMWPDDPKGPIENIIPVIPEPSLRDAGAAPPADAPRPPEGTL